MSALKADFELGETRSNAGGVAASPRRRLLIQIDNEICIPPRVVDLESFCRWTCSDDYPEHGQISYLAGLLWVDLSMEELYGHNQLKVEFASVLNPLAKKSQLGRFIGDGMWMKNKQADLSTEPDGMFVSYESLRTKRVKRVKSRKGILFQLSGTPDMALEIVSETSEPKDTQKLFALYWKAGIPEYWPVDVRGDKLRFHIFKHEAKGYVATRHQPGGWLKSAVFGKSFRLIRELDPLGDPQYTLEVRD